MDGGVASLLFPLVQWGEDGFVRTVIVLLFLFSDIAKGGSLPVLQLRCLQDLVSSIFIHSQSNIKAAQIPPQKRRGGSVPLCIGYMLCHPFLSKHAGLGFEPKEITSSACFALGDESLTGEVVHRIEAYRNVH